MKRIIVLLFAVAVTLCATSARADFIESAKSTGTTFLSQVHGQIGFGTHNLRVTPRDNSNGFYFARLEAPLFFQNVFVSVEPRVAAGADADRDVEWSGAIAYRIF